jgi:hypothetical protein
MMRGLLALLVVTLLGARWLLRRGRPRTPDLGEAFDRHAGGGGFDA